MSRRYQLIKPFFGTKIYETKMSGGEKHTMLKCAKKCYRDVKNAKIAGVKTFSIRELDTNQIFTFKINNLPQIGGVDPDPDQADGQPTQADPPQGQPFTQLEGEVKILEARVEKLEQMVGSSGTVPYAPIPSTDVYDRNVRKLETQRMFDCRYSRDDSCTIL